MILCVTLNPCLDKTLTVESWTPGDNVRASSCREVVGGKGNNVARALGRLGRIARPVTFLGGVVGDRCAELFSLEKVGAPIVVPSAASTREIVTIRSPSTPSTAFFDPDPSISAEEAEALVARVEGELASGTVEALTLSGSSPSPHTHGAFGELIALAQARKVPTFLDTYGPSLDAIWGFWPDSISLNRRELAAYLRVPDPSDDDVARAFDRWSSRGVRFAVVTDGPGPVLARVDGRSYRVRVPSVDVVNPIGSGDCLVAGLVDAHLSRLDAESSLRRGVAAALANTLAWDAADIDPDAVSRFEADLAGSGAVEGVGP